MAIRLGPAHPRGMVWNGAGGWLIFSQALQVNFSRTVWITFHWRGMTSSVSLAIVLEPMAHQWLAILAHLHDTVRPAARAGRGSLDHHTLARQMFGERFAHRLARREGAHGAGLVLRRCLFSGQRILGCRGFQVFKLQFQLIDQPRTALGGDAVFVAAQLGDLQLQFLNHRLGAGRQGARLHQIAFRGLRTGCLRGQFSAQSGDLGSGI